jgi:ribosomal protein L37AE/L43A
VARYVLLEFDDNEEARQIVEALQDSGTMYVDELGMYVHAKVKGYFFKPTQFCECVPLEDKSVRGAKFGLWICIRCHKPKKGYWQHPKNLIEPEGLHSRDRALYLGVVEGMDKPHYRIKEGR